METNFDFIKLHWPKLFKMASQSENYVFSDPQSSIIKLRCFSELITAYLYQNFKIQFDSKLDFYNRLINPKFKNIINKNILSKLHAIRLKGNLAVHHNKATSEDAIWLLEEAYLISCWFYKAHANANQEICREFVIPKDSGNKESELTHTKEELEKTHLIVEELQKQINNLQVGNQFNIKEFEIKDNQIINSMDMKDEEVTKRISIEDIYLDYQLTLGQTKLLQELKTFLFDNNKNVFLLKGYAGTGKTFITKGLTEYLTTIGRRYILAAPTGKAAKVIQEKTKSDAFTIHKTIYSDKDLQEYKQSEEDRTYKFYFDLRVNENSNDTVYIIDEASMISNVYSEMEFIRFGSGHLLNDLFKYINLDQNDHNKKIIFIGDTAQLPPIGMNFSPALNVDYLNKKFKTNISEFELTQVLRQKEASGILKNSIDIRNALENKIFNKLDINTSYTDVQHIEHEDFISKYLKVTNNKLDKDTMVIAHTNASVKEYNLSIRKQFFKNTDEININDKIIILSNSSHYDIDLSNGDFGLVRNILNKTEHKIITLKRKHDDTNIIEEIKVNLDFKDIELIVKDINNKPFVIKCKIIENLLFSEQANLSSDENKAIYLDFVMRNPNIKPNTQEFKDKIKSDPYFNALKIKFGYAITCHKAQGSEWKNVLLNCKSNQKTLSESFFRWIYTAITRSSKNLYTLDEPHIGILDDVMKIAPHMEYIKDTINDISLTKTDIPSDNPFNIEDKFLLELYKKIMYIIHSNNIKILDLQHNQNQEQYTFESNNEQSKIIIYYNASDVITSINPIETNNLSNLLKNILDPLKNHILIIEKHTDFTFNEKFLEDFYLALKDKLDDNIIIANINHLNYMERYTFSRNEEIAIIDIYYNGKGKFKSPTPNNKSNSKQLIQDILGYM